jgi:hypothetical protein
MYCEKTQDGLFSIHDIPMEVIKSLPGILDNPEHLTLRAAINTVLPDIDQMVDEFIYLKAEQITRSKQVLDLLHPDASHIRFEDIASGLSYKSHYAGQTPAFFSIAQHSLLVLDLLESEKEPIPNGLKKAALLHDAAEA